MKTMLISGEISAAADIIKSGGLVAVPTETVYGLACNGLNEAAVKRIYEVKGRPEIKPLSLMVSDARAMEQLCRQIPQQAEFLAECFWPGPLTIVLKAKDSIPEIVRAGGQTVGLRCPAQQQTLELLSLAGVPLAAPSANPSGAESPKTAEAVMSYFDGIIDAVIDGGECSLGLESTIIDMSETPYKILRQGAAAAADIFMALCANMTIIGITGGTGSGKTTALDAITDMGGLVIDCDGVYHELLMNSREIRSEINRRFPNAIAENSHDTKALGDIVFNDPQALSDLNGITHRFVGEEVRRRLTDHALNGGRLAAIDAIALIEGGISNICKATVGIIAPTESRIQRLMLREGISREYAALRIAAQKPNEFFEKECDFTALNDGSIESFYAKCKKIFEDIIGR